MGRAVRILPFVRIVAVVAVAIAPTTLVVASAAGAGLPHSAAALSAAAAPSYSNGAITLSVVSTRDVNPADPNFADTCPWPSTRPTSGFAPIVAEGDQADFAAGKSLNLPGGKYLISVKADGFKIDGAHFTVDGGSQAVKVGLNPTPLPLATIQIQVYDDYAPTPRAVPTCRASTPT